MRVNITASIGTEAIAAFLVKLIAAEDGTDVTIQGVDSNHGLLVVATLNEFTVAMTLDEATSLLNASVIKLNEAPYIADFALYLKHVIHTLKAP